LYPALTQSKCKLIDSYMENQILPTDPFVKQQYTEQESHNPSNFEMYVKASRACRIIVDDLDNIHKGSTYWSEAEWSGFTLPAQGRSKDYCKKWMSKGCGNTKQHPQNKHYAEHTLKSCKTKSCPKCHVDWINKLAGNAARRLGKYSEDKKFNFRHIVLSPPPHAVNQSYDQLKKWFDKVLKVANITTASFVFHPNRFRDEEKIQPYASPHFHLIVYGKITNTTEFYKKTRWIIKNKGDLKKELDVFNCVRYMLSHSGVKGRKFSIVYLGDISYRKLKIEKEPQSHHCPYCYLPLAIFRLIPSSKSRPPPIDHVGLWDSSCFELVEIDEHDSEPRIPFYDLNERTQEVTELQLYSFQEILHVKTVREAISDRVYSLLQAHKITALDSESILSFC
jgi:hypothetical protein